MVGSEILDAYLDTRKVESIQIILLTFLRYDWYTYIVV